jgi:catechol 2,3-dioxygenase-like lactoylglutathione lyase family enzyme
MSRRFACTTLLVRNYDEALAFYTQALRFELIEDTRLSPTKRWLVVAPSREGGALLLAQAGNDEQAAMVGRQGAGRVWLFLHTDDLDEDIAHMQAQGVRFLESPRSEAYGRVVVFEDLYGNRWDLIEPRIEPQTEPRA